MHVSLRMARVDTYVASGSATPNPNPNPNPKRMARIRTLLLVVQPGPFSCAVLLLVADPSCVACVNCNAVVVE